MDIDEYRDRKRNLESTIKEELCAFEEDTGASVDRVYLKLVREASGGSVVGSVEVEADL